MFALLQQTMHKQPTATFRIKFTPLISWSKNPNLKAIDAEAAAKTKKINAIFFYFNKYFYFIFIYFYL